MCHPINQTANVGFPKVGLVKMQKLWFIPLKINGNVLCAIIYLKSFENSV